PRQVASRPIEARNKPELHGVSADGEHDWDVGGRSLSRESRKHARCDDYSHSKLDQISRQRWQPVSLVSRPAIFDHQVPAFNIAGLVQAPPEAGQPATLRHSRPKRPRRPLLLCSMLPKTQSRMVLLPVSTALVAT